MLPRFKPLHLFESKTLIIIELKRNDLQKNAVHEEIFHWLYLDKKSGALVKLWFRSQDSSGEIEERYFEQGFLKFNNTQATFIEKFNSAQHTLDNRTGKVIPVELTMILEDYLKQPNLQDNPSIVIKPFMA